MSSFCVKCAFYVKGDFSYMSVAAKYINRELLAIFVTALLMLLLVAVGGRFIGYLQEAAMGKFTGTTVLTIMALRLPEFVQQVAPFAIYVAIVLTMGRLYAEQEMVVLQGAGASTQRLLSWISISLGFVVALVAASGLNAMAPRVNGVTGLILTAGPVAVLIVLAATTVLIAVVAPIAPTAADVQLPAMAAPSPISIGNRKPRA